MFYFIKNLVVKIRYNKASLGLGLMLCILSWSNYVFADNKIDHRKEQRTISQQILNYFDSFKLAQKQKDSVLMADFLYEIAITEQLKGENDSAYVKFNKALAIYQSQNDSLGIANCITQIGSIYRYEGKYDKALANYLKALDNYTFLEDTLGKVKVLNNLGITYRLLSDYPKAISYYSNAEKLALKINTDFLATIYNSLGSYYWFQKKNDSALIYYKKAMQYEPEELTLQERRCAILNNVGNVYRDTYKTDSALYYYFESLKLSTSLGIINLSAITYKNIGKTYYIETKYDKALRYLKLGNKYARQSKLAKTIIEIYYIESLIYQDLKQFEKSLEKYKLYAQLQDSVVSSE